MGKSVENFAHYVNNRWKQCQNPVENATLIAYRSWTWRGNSVKLLSFTVLGTTFGVSLIPLTVHNPVE